MDTYTFPMCYAYKPVRGEDGTIYKVPLREFRLLELEGRIKPSPDGYHYARATIGVILILDGAVKTAPMRWDFVPRDYLSAYPDMRLQEVLKKKDSRKENPDTGKPWGFEAYNARSETIRTRYSFKDSWKEGKRCIIPATSFKERPNMEKAPLKTKGREYEIALDQPYFLGGIWDKWERNGETLYSCSVITMDSEGLKKISDIWHERHPFLMTPEQVDPWLDPKISPAQAFRMIRQLDDTHMEVREINASPQISLFEGLEE
ncbi:MAG: SOS response-associated peptidase family protein [Fibrobacteria bacterium]